MNFDLDETIEIIKKNKNFLKLEKIIENNANHDNETMLHHSLRTYDIARKNIDGHFISNKSAKKKFDKYVNKEIGGIKKRDLMLITALIHDIGKIIIFDDNGNKKTITTKSPDGSTFAPEHGYWGSLIVENVVSETNLPKECIEYVSNIINVHLAGENYWADHKLDNKDRLWELKLRAHNLHVEMFFNVYCDLYYGRAFKESLKYPVELLNMPEAYEEVKFSFVD